MKNLGDTFADINWVVNGFRTAVSTTADVIWPKRAARRALRTGSRADISWADEAAGVHDEMVKTLKKNLRRD